MESHSIKILFIDDYHDIRRLIANFIRDYGFEVIEACDGEEGMQLAKDHNPDLILLDLVMPRMDGEDVMDALIEHDELKDTPVIIFSNGSKRKDCTANIVGEYTKAEIQPQFRGIARIVADYFDMV